MRQCTKCQTLKEFSCFTPDKQKKDGLCSWCKTCRWEQVKAWRKNNPEWVRNAKLKTKFRITSEQYDAMLDKQSGKCAICRGNETITTNGIVKKLAVDHNRSCCPGNKSCGSCIRGLLCYACNNGIGIFRDSVDFMQSAITYLQNNNSLKGETK